jgi:hypothetical protein
MELVGWDNPRLPSAVLMLDGHGIYWSFNPLLQLEGIIEYAEIYPPMSPREAAVIVGR